MTKLLDDAVEAVRKMPAEAQDEIARMMLSMAGNDEPYELTDDERAIIERSMAEAARGEFVSDEEVERFWKKLGV
jgi:predicted transcriptional regulator